MLTQIEYPQHVVIALSGRGVTARSRAFEGALDQSSLIKLGWIYDANAAPSKAPALSEPGRLGSTYGFPELHYRLSQHVGGLNKCLCVLFIFAFENSIETSIWMVLTDRQARRCIILVFVGRMELPCNPIHFLFVITLIFIMTSATPNAATSTTETNIEPMTKLDLSSAVAQLAEKTAQSGKSKRKPDFKNKRGTCSIAVYANARQKDDTIEYKFTLSRSGASKDGPVTRYSFRPQDAQDLINLIGDAAQYILGGQAPAVAETTKQDENNEE